MIAELLASGRIADIALALIAAEALLLVWIFRRKGAAGKLSQALAGLAAGAALFLALRASLTNSGGTAAFLALALLAHATEFALRLRKE